jgi:hypothetical protein
MKKYLFLTLFAILLSGCGIRQDSSASDMETRIAQILTEEASAVSPNEVLPQPTDTPADIQTITQSAEGPQIVIVTPTPTATIPPATPTITPTFTQVPTETATSTSTPVPSITPPASDPRLYLGAPSAVDPMDNADTWHWPTGTQEYTSIDFKDGFMEFTGLQDLAGWRLPMTASGTDVYIEMTVRTGQCSGEDNYGIIFRVPVFHEADRGYLFTISCDGRYRLTKWDGQAGTGGVGIRLVDWRSNANINAGANQTNRIGVLTVDNRFYLYANGYLLNDSFILEDTKDPYPGGYFGVFVTSRETPNFTIYVDEMSYWLNAYKP